MPPLPAAPPPEPPKPERVPSTQTVRFAREIGRRAIEEGEHREIGETIEMLLTTMPIPGTPSTRITAVCDYLGRMLPSTTRFDDLLDEVIAPSMRRWHPELSAATAGYTTAFEAKFVSAQAGRREWEAKRDAKQRAERERKTRLSLMASGR